MVDRLNTGFNANQLNICNYLVFFVLPTVNTIYTAY